MFRIFTKINIVKIVIDHVATLKDYNRAKYSYLDIILFFVFPLFISGILILFSVLLNKDLVGILINVFSIFAGLLFNLLVLIYDVISKIDKPLNSSKTSNSIQAVKLKIDTLEQIFSNISFEILLSLFNVIFLAISTLFTIKEASYIFSFLIFYLVTLFTLSLLMVLKRVHKLLSDEIKEQRNSINGHSP